MKLHIIAYGKAGRGPEANLVDRYLKRITWPTGVTELSERAAAPVAPPGARSILLDERGTSFTSQAFAERLGKFRDDGTRELRFVIGPADGHSQQQRDSADLLLALGPATWPHLLARAMLAEQLYRAFTILTGHPYHRE
ncbi:MAG: 23S rRNA (pseudouridine(1915)-N(3))-methyltransferase RlmH [Sphingomonadaceae bacterium]